MTIDIKKVFVRGLQDSCVREFVFEEDFNIIHGSTVFHSHPSHSDAVYCSKVYGSRAGGLLNSIFSVVKDDKQVVMSMKVHRMGITIDLHRGHQWTPDVSEEFKARIKNWLKECDVEACIINEPRIYEGTD